MSDIVTCKGHDFWGSEVARMASAMWDLLELTYIEHNPYAAQGYLDQVVKPQFSFYSPPEFMALKHAGRLVCQEINTALRGDWNEIYAYIKLEGEQDA